MDKTCVYFLSELQAKIEMLKQSVINSDSPKVEVEIQQELRNCLETVNMYVDYYQEAEV